MRPRIVLHIGRNKAGSTTLQDFCLRERAWLGQGGVNYALFGHLSHSRPDTPGFATFEELRAHALRRPDETQLVSNEFMFGWPDDFTEAAARVLHDCEVRILAYLRPYDGWIVSAYAEETRKGMNLRDINDYVVWMAPRISAWRHLAKWAEGFGWDALRVRGLGGALTGQGLVEDFAQAVGLARPPASASPSNAAPHWLELELVRSLTELNGEVEWCGVRHDEADPLLRLLRPLTRGVASVDYLARADRAALRALYAEDAARIEAAGGTGLPLSQPDQGSERGVVPAFSAAPAEVLDAFFEQAAAPAFLQAHPAAAARARRLARELTAAAP